MPDEPETPVTPDTLTPAADTDWQARYTSLQPEYTRATQALKDRESAWEDDTAVLSRLQELRPDLFEDDDDDTPLGDDDDPVAPLRSELDEFKQWRNSIENERGAERFARDLKAELGDETVPAKVGDWIKNRTTALGNNEKALKQAVSEYREFAGEIRGPVRKDSPAPPPPGTAGEKKYDPRNKEERRARMAASIEAARQQ